MGGKPVLEQKISTPVPAPFSSNGMMEREKFSGGIHGRVGEPRRGWARPQHQVGREPGPAAVPPIVHEVLRSPGRPLDEETRAFMEPRFGHDFSRVRVHTDARAAELARMVNALAYTVGKDVVFGEGQYHPGSNRGRRQMAHELAHVIQNPETNETSTPLVLSRPGDPGEREATSISASLLMNNRSTVHRRSRANILYRQDHPEDEPQVEEAFPEYTPPPGHVERPPLSVPLTPEEMFRTMTSATVFREGAGEGRILGHGSATRAFIQVIDRNGNRIAEAFGRNDGRVHAEEHALGRLRTQLELFRSMAEGGRLDVVVNQHVCSDVCAPALREFAEQFGLERVDSHVFVRESLRGRGEARPRQTFTTQTSPSVEGLSARRIDEVIYQRTGGGSGPHGAPVRSAEPDLHPAAPEAAHATEASPPVESAPSQTSPESTVAGAPTPPVESAPTHPSSEPARAVAPTPPVESAPSHPSPEPIRTAAPIHPAEPGSAPSPIEPAHVPTAHEPMGGGRPIVAESGLPRGAAEGAALVFHQAQVASIEAFERQRAEDELRRMEPRIQRYRLHGEWVQVYLVMDEPEMIDVLGQVAGFTEASQIRRFHHMYFEHASSQAGLTSLRGPTLEAAPPHSAPAAEPQLRPPEGRTWRTYPYRLYPPEPAAVLPGGQPAPNPRILEMVSESRRQLLEESGLAAGLIDRSMRLADLYGLLASSNAGRRKHGRTYGIDPANAGIHCPVRYRKSAGRPRFSRSVYPDGTIRRACGQYSSYLEGAGRMNHICINPIDIPGGRSRSQKAADRLCRRFHL